ncbi:hypothetical protein EDB89DRAFT_2065865 [Lactarius sanguifluus]|nr:hypothetical protein EDB89DRAFT_2065865 [Lactarius sanguifluus]
MNRLVPTLHLSAPFLVDGHFAHGKCSRGQSLSAPRTPSASSPPVDSAPGFLSFLSGYIVFIGPITGIVMIYGVNWRAGGAMLVSVPSTFPGLLHRINPSVHIGTWTRPFDIAYLFGFALASTVYFALSKLFPANETILDRARS